MKILIFNLKTVEFSNYQQNTERSNNSSGLMMQYRERNASYLDLSKKLGDQKVII